MRGDPLKEQKARPYVRRKSLNRARSRDNGETARNAARMTTPRRSGPRRFVRIPLVAVLCAFAAVSALAPPVATASSPGTETGWEEPDALAPPARRARPEPLLIANAAGQTVATWWEFA